MDQVFARLWFTQPVNDASESGRNTSPDALSLEQVRSGVMLVTSSPFWLLSVDVCTSISSLSLSDFPLERLENMRRDPS